jgi:exodeoxyribonuclease-5
MDSNYSQEQFQRLFDENFDHNLTEEQNILRSKLYEFIFKIDGRKIFILRGYAGTGKTSMLGAFVKSLTHLKIKTKLLAPTGRAAKVFALKAKKEAFTIHKQIYRSGTQSGEVVKLDLMPNLHTKTLFIIDEASMIASDNIDLKEGSNYRNLLEDLINYVFSGKDCFLMFVGDEGQLPPVGSDFSPALNQEYLNHFFPNLKSISFSLNNVVRQEAASGILSVATSIRQENRTDYISKSSRLKDVQFINGLDFQ